MLSAHDLLVLVHLVYPFSQFVNKSDTILVGLANGTIYDVVDNNSATGTIMVNATYFNVSCGTIPIPDNITWDGSTLLQAENGSLPLRALGNCSYMISGTCDWWLIAGDDLTVSSDNFVLDPAFLLLAVTSSQFVDSAGNAPGIQYISNYTLCQSCHSFIKNHLIDHWKQILVLEISHLFQSSGYKPLLVVFHWAIYRSLLIHRPNWSKATPYQQRHPWCFSHYKLKMHRISLWWFHC